MVGGDVFDGGVALVLAPAPDTSTSATTRPSAPAAPSEAPTTAERFFAKPNMDEPPSWECPRLAGFDATGVLLPGNALSPDSTRRASQRGAMRGSFYSGFT